MSRTVMARRVRCALVLGLLSSTALSTPSVFAQPSAQPSPVPGAQSPAATPAATPRVDPAPAPVERPGPAHVEPRDPAALLTGKAGGLTAARVAEQAVVTSFAAAQKAQEVEAAVANLDRALYDFMPRLSGQVSYYRLSEVESPSLGTLVVAPGAAPGPLAPDQALVAAPLSFDSPQNSTTFSSSLTLPLSDYVLRLIPARAAAQARLNGSRESLSATERKTAYDARALYYDWVRAELEAAAAAQNLELGRE